MANIRDIAKRSGVSIATVSRYLNGTERVSEEAGKKIQREIDKSGYIPNALAKAIFTKKSEIIALMIPNIVNPFFNQLATIIENHCHERGYTLMLCNTDDNPVKERKYLEVLKAHRVAGIIASRPKSPEEYKNINIPVISFENKISESIITVSSDNYGGGRKAFEHLYNNGCRKILHIKGPSGFEATEERCQGFIDGAKEKNLDIDIVQLETDFNVEMLGKDLKSIENIDKYQGIFVFNDMAGAVVMKSLRYKKVEVPKDVQIIGFDDSFIGEILSVPLTTIRQSIEEIGRIIAEKLIGEIEGEVVSKENIIVETKLIKRESTLL